MKFGICLNFVVAVFLGAILALLLPFAQGAEHVGLMDWLMSFAVSGIAAFLIPTILPLMKISTWCLKAFNTTRETAGGTVLFIVFMNTFMTLGMALVMTIFMTGVGPLGPTTLLDRYASSVMMFWPIVNAVFFIIYPFAFSIAMRLAGPPVQPGGEHAEGK